MDLVIYDMNQTPPLFELLNGQTSNSVGQNPVSVKHSGWDKQDGRIQLTVFADGIPHVKILQFSKEKVPLQLIFFRPNSMVLEILGI